MKTGTIIAGVSIFVLIAAFVTLIIVREDPYFSKNRHVNIQKTEELTSVTCADAPSMTLNECESFIHLWKQLHQERLGISAAQFDNRVLPTKIWKIDARYDVLRVDYQVHYGDIIVAAHDQFPLTISPGIQPSIPSMIVPRDNSPLNIEHIKQIGKAHAWNSTVTFFELSDLEIPNYEDIEAFAADHLISDDVTYIDAELSFNAQGKPEASLRGTNKDGSRCYSGYILLMNSEYSVHYSGPCIIN